MKHAQKQNKLLSPISLAANLHRMVEWSQNSYLPDPVNYADLVSDIEFVCDMWMDENADPRPFDEFPYPKTGGGTRSLAVVSVRDHVRLRVAAGLIATATDPKLASTVYSSRLGERPPAWAFKRRGFKRFRQAAARDCRTWNCSGMVRTDVRSFYPSVPIERLIDAVFGTGANRRAAAFLMTTLLRWNDRDGVRGLPVGPDACGVLGTFYLRPLDEVMAQLFAAFHRYTDDIIYFYSASTARDAGLAQVRDVLLDLGLDLALNKTKIIEDPREAMESIRRAALDYLESGLHYGPPGDLSKVFKYWDERMESGELDTIDLRWCLRTLRWQKHPHAVDTLHRRPDVVARDPKEVADYLSGCGHDADPAVDVMVSTALDSKADPPSRLHGLRFLASKGVERSRGLRILDVARDSSNPSPIREWAWAAYGASGALDVSDVVDSVGAEDDPDNSRAALLTLRSTKSVRGVKFAARHIVRRFPELRPAARWAADVLAA